SCRKVCPLLFPPKRAISAGRNRSLKWRNWSSLKFQIDDNTEHENSIFWRMRVWRDSLRMQRRADHDVQVPLSQLPTNDWQRIFSRSVGSGRGLSSYARSIALPFHTQCGRRPAQTRLLRRVWLSTDRRREH